MSQNKPGSRFAAFALLTLALAASCDRTPTTPSTRVPPEEPQQPVPVFTTRIELIAPRTLGYVAGRAPETRTGAFLPDPKDCTGMFQSGRCK